MWTTWVVYVLRLAPYPSDHGIWVFISKIMLGWTWVFFSGFNLVFLREKFQFEVCRLDFQSFKLHLYKCSLQYKHFCSWKKCVTYLPKLNDNNCRREFKWQKTFPFANGHLFPFWHLPKYVEEIVEVQLKNVKN